MPSLPAWVALRTASVRSEVQPDPETRKWRRTPTLPSSLILNAAERDELESHIRELEALCKPTPGSSPDAEGAMLIDLTRMMLALSGPRQSEASAESRGEAYMVALDDLPPWAVRSAIRRWYRGDAGLNERGEPFDYRWCPAPADLRKVAMHELWRVKARIVTLRTLLTAEPLIEFTPEHCHTMRARLASLMHETFGIPPVGTDGSGGMVGEG
jgi:hypothetical protein